MCCHSDTEKVQATYLKLVALHKEFNHQDEVISFYNAVLATYDLTDPSSADASSSCSELWMEYTAYVLNRDEMPENCWEKVSTVQLACKTSIVKPERSFLLLYTCRP